MIKLKNIKKPIYTLTGLIINPILDKLIEYARNNNKTINIIKCGDKNIAYFKSK